MNLQTSGKAKRNYQRMDLKSVITKYLYYWPLFILGLIISLAGAWVYLQYTNPTYEVYATILVKDEKKAPDEKPLLQELNQSSSPKNAETEIQILTSKNLVSKVVNDLQLWTVYKTSSGLATQDLYGTAPFKFVLKQNLGKISPHIITITIKDKNSFTTNNLSGKPSVVPFNSLTKSNFGVWSLVPTEFLNQYIGSEITININNPNLVADTYIKNLDSHLLDKATPTIGLFITDEVPLRGENFLNKLISVYNDASAAEEKRTTKSTIDFIDNRLKSLSGELGSAEQNVEGYSSSQGLTDISTQSKAYIENVQGNDVKLNDVNVQLNIIDGISRYINSSSNNESAPATIGINDPALNSLIEKLSQLQLKKVALLATTPETNPIFEPLNKQIITTKSAIKENIQGIKISLLNTKRGLESFSQKSESSIKNIPGQERQFVDMKRQQSIKENLYVYLLQKREELALSYAANFIDARIVDQANLGDIKWPKKSFVFLIALLAGFGIPFFIIYFRQSFNNKIIDRKTIEEELDVPILGELSFQNYYKHIIIFDKSQTIVGEQFKSLRTNLNYLHSHDSQKNNHFQAADKGGRVTLLTSSVSKEGKSFVSSNLAASLAASGKKTIILEMDLRRPKISGAFNLPNGHLGITDYLNGKTTIENIIQTTAQYPGLYIAGCGEIPDNPAELLESEKLNDLLATLKSEFDDIIIDSPPMHLVTDAMIIARVADVSLYIIRQGKTGKDELDFIKEVNKDNKLPNLNIVFNGISKSKYGYGYKYDSSYYNSKPAKPSFDTGLKLFFNRF